MLKTLLVHFDFSPKGPPTQKNK